MPRITRIKSYRRRTSRGIVKVKAHNRRLTTTRPFYRQKNVLRLPIKTSIIVPSTKDKNRRISDRAFNKRVINTKRFLSNTQGGYTSVKAQGGYTDNKGRLIKERVAVIESYSTKAAYKRNKHRIERHLRHKAKEWGQESVGYEYEDDLYVVKPKKGRR